MTAGVMNTARYKDRGIGDGRKYIRALFLAEAAGGLFQPAGVEEFAECRA